MKHYLRIFLLFMFCGVSVSLMAQKQKITLSDVIENGTFNQKSLSGLRSMNDGLHYTVLENNGQKIVKYSYKTGQAIETLVDLVKNKSELKYISDYQFNADESYLLLYTNVKPIYRRSFTADYYLYDFKNREIKPLSEKGSEQCAVFSPTGRYIAFARNNNLFIHDIRFHSEKQITFDGEYNHIINGLPDWVYEEEFSFNRAFEWAPDDSALAYIRFDESQVRQFPINIFGGMAPAIDTNAVYPSVYTYKYPKAGEKNSVVSVHVYDLADKMTMKMNIGEEQDIYIPRIRWTKNPKQLAIIRLNRRQNNMEILSANVRTGVSSILYRDSNKWYIDESIFDTFQYTEDGKYFVICSEKTGYMHLYLHSVTGQQKRAITSGKFDVTDYLGYNPTKGLFYYASHEESSLEKYVYSVDEKGKKIKLTPLQGWNEVSFSKNFMYYINTMSNATTPLSAVLYNGNGKPVRTLLDNKELKVKLTKYELAHQEYITIPAADGTTQLNAWVMKPLNFDATKSYPLLITQYSGPNSQQVMNSWGGISWLHYLAQEGYVVACIDPRGTASRGESFRKCTYMQLGKIESDDMIAAAKWLASQTWIDAKRVGIWGWSYGGFMSSLCLMKGNDVFKMAIAVAPVTSYRYYDSIYTERYMRMPKENEEGYDQNCPLAYADQLKGNLLLCHGTADDNVHVQNTYELAERLVQSGKTSFDMMIYNNRNHGIFGGNTRMQLYSKFVDYLNKNLK